VKRGVNVVVIIFGDLGQFYGENFGFFS
jgi:hypothetical protein